MTDPYDPDVYSDQSISVARDDGVCDVQRLTWREVAELLRREVSELRRFQQMVLDLDRNANGRHEGDPDVYDPTGISQGNPLVRTGEVLGYGLRGDKYVMPERGRRHDPRAWGAR